MLEKFPDSIYAQLDISKFPDIRYSIILKKRIENAILTERIENAKLLILINDAQTDPIIESRGVLVWNKGSDIN